MNLTSRKTSRGRTPQGEPNPVDVYVGARIRMRRNLLGWSQEKLAEMLGLTFQQVQKYEKGQNRVSASRLWDFSVVLEAPISFFYEDMDKRVARQSPRMFSNPDAEMVLNESQEIFNADPLHRQETLELIRAYYKIPNRQAAKHLYNLTIAMSKSLYLTGKEDVGKKEKKQ